MIEADDLLDHAESLLTSGRKGAPAQIDLKRAVSAAYYAVFHKLLTDTADLVVGRSKRSKPAYALVYRSFDHARMRKKSNELLDSRSNLAKRLPSYGISSVSDEIRKGATAFVDLQSARHRADYDPNFKLKLETAKAHIDSARVAIRSFSKAGKAEYEFFLFALLFEPRD